MASSSYKVKPADLFGRLGQGIGQGFNEQFPKDVERGRMAQHLENLGKQENLTPLQQLTGTLTAPGITPQGIQSVGNLLERQSIAQALGQGQGQGNAAPPLVNPNQLMNDQTSGKAPSITSRKALEATLKPYIPLSQKDRIAAAQERYPDLYKRDYEKALGLIDKEESIKEAQSNALQGQRQNELGVQNTIEKELGKQKGRFAGDIPSRTYNNLENKAINAVLPVDEGGEDLTEREAAQKYGDQLDDAARDYDAVKQIGNYGFLWSGRDKILRQLKDVRDGFKERDDLENLADSYISETGLSPRKAYYLAFDPADTPKVNNILKSLPVIPKIKLAPGGSMTAGSLPPKNKAELQGKAFKELSENLGDASILAIGEELRNKGYDEDKWFDYVSNKKDKLHLNATQKRELSKDRGIFPTLNDIFLFFGIGKPKMVE